MSSPRPLLYSLPSGPSFVELDVEKVKAAKLSLDLDFKVVPQRFTGAQPGRVLAIGAPPRYLCDYFLLSENAGPEEYRNAVAWVLGTHDDLDATDVVDTLTSVLGPGVREISPEELESEKRYADYVLGRV